MCQFQELAIDHYFACAGKQVGFEITDGRLDLAARMFQGHAGKFRPHSGGYRGPGRS
ncbi:MAG: hypothetical protein R2860_17215 [Desulfobacterales bacterium]